MRQHHQARPFVARIRHGENHSTVEVEGEVDLVTADRFHDAIDEAVRVSLFVDVDLRHVTFMGSVGLQALLDAQLADFPPLVLVETVATRGAPPRARRGGRSFPGSTGSTGGDRAAGVITVPPQTAKIGDIGALNEAIGSLAMMATEHFTPEELLQRLADVAATHLDVDGVGVMIADGSASRFVHSSGADVTQVEKVQELLQVGPCRSAIIDRAEVVIDDLTSCTNPEWEPYVAAALEGGLRSTIALPLVSRGRSWGVLDLYRSRPDGWDDPFLDVGRLLANVAVSYLVMASDREAAVRAQKELAHQATHDPLTGLPNRALAFDRLDRALAAAVRRRRRVAVFFIDLDGFKAVNDTLGHETGDQVLIAVAERLTASLRRTDSTARLGGDEFLVICEDLDGSDGPELRREVHGIASELEHALQEPIRVRGRDVVVTASLGIAVAGEAARPDDVIAAADDEMYAAKRRRQRSVKVIDVRPAPLRPHGGGDHPGRQAPPSPLDSSRQ